jgi:hypothetical protein
MDAFEALQSRLQEVWEANRPGSTTPHVVVGLPSFDLSESILAHYAQRIASLEHRYLHASLLLRSIPACEFIHVTCQHPGQEVLEYYAHLGSPDDPAAFRKRVTVFEVPDLTPRSIATKLLERPDLIAALRDTIGGRLAMLEPWNVTEPVVDLALQLGTPVNGSSPDLWPLGFKSAGRQLIQRAGVPTPLGREGVHTLDDVTRAIDEIRQARPLATALVLKTDNSGAGDGNRTVPLNGPDGRPRPLGEIRHSLERLPAWYLQDLRAGGVVEELIGQAPASPSVQVDINPDHSVTVLSTHEQVLGGEGGQVYEGCSFPANPAYAVQLAEYGRAVGEELAKAGAVGRFALDFVAEQGESGWRLYALEVNLRKGGTTHPYTALRHLIRGRYEPEQGWVRKEGDTRCYRSTDNLVDPEWQRLSPAAVIEAIERARLSFDHATGTGVVLHMLSGLAVDGRLGLTAFGVSPEQCDLLHESAREAIGLVAALA